MILALITALALTSPTLLVENARLEDCTGQLVCPFTDQGRVCVCAGPIVNLGLWDPRPAPADWPSNGYLKDPPDFGAYPMEKAP